MAKSGNSSADQLLGYPPKSTQIFMLIDFTNWVGLCHIILLYVHEKHTYIYNMFSTVCIYYIRIRNVMSIPFKNKQVLNTK